MSEGAPVSEIEESPGVVSSIRQNVRRAVRMGQLMIAAGVGLSVAMLILDRYQLMPVAIALASGGPGLMLGALATKAWQAQAENQ